MQEGEPLITFIMCSRKQGNPDSNIEEFFNTVLKNITDQEKAKIEFLIKFDTDDEDTLKKLLNRNWHGKKALRVEQPNYLKTIPLSIRTFVYSRGEGRRSLHNDYMFLFSQRNPASKFISFVTDDCVIVKPGMIVELERIKDKDWVFLGDKRPNAKKYTDWRTNQDWRNDVSMFPVVSTKIFECVQNMGWQVNIDNWITLLHTILVNKYGLDFWEGSYETYVGRAGGKSSENQYGKIYNSMEINNINKCENPYYFNLVEQQAKNIYLNYIEDKTKEILRPWVK